MTLEQMIAKAHEGYFVRDAGRNLVICPQGETLRTMGELVPGWQNDGAEAPLAGQMTLPDGLNPPRIENLEATTIFRQPSRYCNVRNFKSDF